MRMIEEFESYSVEGTAVDLDLLDERFSALILCMLGINLSLDF